MARTVRDAKLETREARRRLTPRAAPRWRTLEPGALHLGYRRRRKDAPGTWSFRVYNGPTDSGSPYSTHAIGLADDYSDANGNDVLSFAEAQALAHERSKRPQSGSLTVATAMADYVAELKLEKKTGDEVEAIVARHVLPKLGNKRVSDLTTVELKKWHRDLAAAPALVRSGKGKEQRHKSAPVTEDQKRARRARANRILTSLKAGLNQAFKAGAVNSDLEWRRVTPFKKVDARRPGHLTNPEARRLINAADEPSGFRDLVRAALETGARYGELCRLTAGDVQGGKLAIVGGKTGSRHVVLTDDGRRFFEKLAAGREKDELILGRADGSGWTASAQARPMLKACKRAKISPIGFHQLRHSWASLALKNHMPMMVVARNLGHVDVRMVERHYGHLTESFIDDAIRNSAPKFGAVKRSNVRTLRA